MTDIQKNAVLQRFENVEYYENYSLKNLNRYKTGGNATFVVYPKEKSKLKSIVDFLIENNINYYVLGLGSNVLISDKGFDGVIIVTKYLNKINIKGNLLICESGAKLIDVINESTLNSLSGLEFACGIPASVGGAVAMNSGCYNKSVSERVSYVVTNKGIYNKYNCQFAYRQSRFLNSEVILEVCFSLMPDELDNIEQRILEYKSFRKNPKGRNCGSIFKNDGFFAGKIIDECNLKGYSVGSASISLEHANFIIAKENCTSSDIYNLIKHVKEIVYKEKQIYLQEEVIYLGEF